VISEIDEIKAIAQRTRDPESGSLRLGVFPTLGPYLLPHLVPLIRARFPRLELLLVEEKTEHVVRMLREGSLDAAVLALPLHEDSLHSEFLFEEPFVLAVPDAHPLAQKKHRLKLSDLEDENLLLLEDGHCLRDQALEVCQLAGAGEKTGFRATSLETLRQMVAANVGITLLPTLAIKPPMARTDNVHLLEFAGHAPSRRLALVWRKSSSMTTFLKRFTEVIRSLPPELMQPQVEGGRATRAQA
jgi:LysR family transcriptional regulator, hydrogen peroxide-inducible genes activator